MDSVLMRPALNDLDPARTHAGKGRRM